MTKKDLKTGMICQVMKGNQYLIYITPDEEITLVPIYTISTLDHQGEYKRLGVNLSTEICLKTNMDDNLIENILFSHAYGWDNNIDPFQIKKIWHPKSPSDLFSFNDEDLIWNLK